MKALHPAVLAILLLCAAAPPLGAASDPEAHWCGTSRSGLEIGIARHEHFERYLERERRAGRLPPPVKSHDTVRQVGDVAVIEDDGTLFLAPKVIDLQGASMQYLRRPKGMSTVRSHLDFKSVLGTRLDLGDDDAVLVEFPEGFRYPFGDEVYTEAWVNSDGNLTFGEPDTASTLRSVARFLDGPPRIAPLFTDLNPATATGENGVYLRFLPGRVRVTWFQVPEFGTNNRNTVQITLFTTGRVTFVYGNDLEASEAVVGVNAFAGSEPLHLMDYDEELPFRPPQRVAIAEHFPAESPQVDEFSIAMRFFEQFRDVYDQLVVWYDFPKSLGRGVLGQARPIQNDVRGIGSDIFDFSPLLGSRGRLESFVEMAGSVVDDYPDDPDRRVFRAGESTMSIVGHEVGHRWLAALRFRHPRDGSVSSFLLGRGQFHWSFFMDSDASLLEGNEIVDNGDGTFTTRGPLAVRYSPLDQYAMGLVPAARVPPFFYVANAQSGGRTNETSPQAGVTIEGDRRDVTVADVIAAEGERVPSASQARKVFRVAFLLVGGPEEEVSQQAIDKVERFRERFEGFFEEATGGNGRVRTKLLAR